MKRQSLALLGLAGLALAGCLFSGANQESNRGVRAAEGYEPIGQVLVTRDSGKEPPGLWPHARLRASSRTSSRAFNAGDLKQRDSFFAEEPGFEWYSVTEQTKTGKRHFVTYERDGLLPYFARRHREGDRLRLLMVDVAPSSLTVDIAYELWRDADDLARLGIRNHLVHGKGAIRCTGRSKIFVWSMGMAKAPDPRDLPLGLCPRPSGWTTAGPAIACTRAR